MCICVKRFFTWTEPNWKPNKNKKEKKENDEWNPVLYFGVEASDPFQVGWHETSGGTWQLSFPGFLQPHCARIPNVYKQKNGQDTWIVIRGQAAKLRGTYCNC